MTSMAPLTSRSHGKTGKQTNGPGALPLPWRHNFWQFYRIVVLGSGSKRNGSDRIRSGPGTPPLAPPLGHVEHKNSFKFNSNVTFLCFLFIFSALAPDSWHFWVFDKCGKAAREKAMRWWWQGKRVTERLNRIPIPPFPIAIQTFCFSCFLSLFFFQPNVVCLFFVSFHCYPKWLHYLYRLFSILFPFCSSLAQTAQDVIHVSVRLSFILMGCILFYFHSEHIRRPGDWCSRSRSIRKKLLRYRFCLIVGHFHKHTK